MAEEGSRRTGTLNKGDVQLAASYVQAYLKHLQGEDFVPPKISLNKPLLVAEALADLLRELTGQLQEGLKAPDATFLPWPILVTNVRQVLDRLSASRRPVLGQEGEKQRALIHAATSFLESAEIVRNRAGKKKSGKFPAKTLKSGFFGSKGPVLELGDSDTDEGTVSKSSSKTEETAELESRCESLELELGEARTLVVSLTEELNKTKEQLQEEEKERTALTALLGKKEMERETLMRKTEALKAEKDKLKKKLNAQAKELKRLRKMEQEKDVLLEERKTLVQKLDTDMQLAEEFRRRLEQLSGSDTEIKQAVDEVKRLQHETLAVIDARLVPDVTKDDVITSLPGDVKDLCVRIQQLVGGHGRVFSQALLGRHLDISRGDLEEGGWFMTPRKFWVLVGRWVTASQAPQTSAPATLAHLRHAWRVSVKTDPDTVAELGGEERQLLEVNFDYLCDNLETLEVAVALRSRGLLTEDAWHFLNTPGTTRHKVDRLLAVVYSLGREGLGLLLQCLDLYHQHVRLQLTRGIMERNITLPDDVSDTPSPDAADRDGEKTDDEIVDADDTQVDLDPPGSGVTAADDDLSTLTSPEEDGMSESMRKQLVDLGSDVRAILASVSSREGRDLSDRVKAIEATLGTTLNSDTWVRRGDLDELFQRVKDVVHRCFDNVSEDLRAKLGSGNLPSQTDPSHAAN